jgi:hypothetical protein
MASDEDLLKLFTCKVAGEEKVEQSKTWVIQCDPQAGRV